MCGWPLSISTAKTFERVMHCGGQQATRIWPSDSAMALQAHPAAFGDVGQAELRRRSQEAAWLIQALLQQPCRQ